MPKIKTNRGAAKRFRKPALENPSEQGFYQPYSDQKDD